MLSCMQEGEEEDGDEAEADARGREPKRKTIRPPGYRRPAPKAKAAAAADEGVAAAAPAEAEGAAARQKAAATKRRTSAEVAAATLPAERTVMVRESTRQRVQEAEEERKVLDAVRPLCMLHSAPCCPSLACSA